MKREATICNNDAGDCARGAHKAPVNAEHVMLDTKKRETFNERRERETHIYLYLVILWPQL